jgi:hypothetical protein
LALPVLVGLIAAVATVAAYKPADDLAALKGTRAPILPAGPVSWACRESVPALLPSRWFEEGPRYLANLIFTPEVLPKGGPMRDFVIHVTDRPGEIARVANALARRDVNIKSITGMGVANQGLIRVIADDIDAARTALRESNIRFEEAELVTVLLENKAGELGGVAGKLANAGLNVQALYVIGLEGDLVELAFAVDDAKKAKKALE